MEVVAVDCDNGAVGQVAEGTANGIGRRIADDRERQSHLQFTLHRSNQINTGAAVDRYTAGIDAVGLNSVVSSFEGAGVGPIRLES